MDALKMCVVRRASYKHLGHRDVACRVPVTDKHKQFSLQDSIPLRRPTGNSNDSEHPHKQH